MIGVVVVTHGQLATELVNAAETIVGDLPHFLAVSIGWHEDVQDAREAIATAIDKVQQPGGVLLMTDMFGGTPSNLVITFLEKDKIEIVTGVNLPMLLRTVCYRQEPLEALVTRALSGASQGIMQVAITAPQNQPKRSHDSYSSDHQQ